MQTLPAKMITIEDKLFDISGFIHPMGRFILSNSSGMDLTKEFYGLSPKIYENYSDKYVEAIKYPHGSHVIDLMNKLMIGSIE